MNKLAILGGQPTIEPESARFVWPRVTPEMEAVVLRQLHTTLSIYDKSGVFKEFEEHFATYHGIPYALLSNSGTSAIFSMFEGIGLGPGDEVICPTYTFFATISPIVYTGAMPVFCDCGPDGNIDPAEVAHNITPRTKAIIVTHMWGIPCEMERLVALAQAHDLWLLEDCSHAHGARYRDQLTGTFGDAAAWSLQGQKVISGGEGGILLTRHADIFHRALLQGHYNKRCKQELPEAHPLRNFASTGFGLKLRAHPLAIAIAHQQFGHLDEWLAQKAVFARRVVDELRAYPFLHQPQHPDRVPSWYAYVMQYVPEEAQNVTIETFVRALHAEGLVEVDRPTATGPIHNLPLFTQTYRAMPRLYYEDRARQPGQFPCAVSFHANAIKLPVWAFLDDEWIVERYIESIRKVADAVVHVPEQFNNI